MPLLELLEWLKLLPLLLLFELLKLIAVLLLELLLVLIFRPGTSSVTLRVTAPKKRPVKVAWGKMFELWAMLV